MIKRISLLFFHIINGIYSNIPFCCIYFFTKRQFFNPEESTALAVSIERNDETFWKMINGEIFSVPENPSLQRAHYVRCHHCFRINHVNNLKKNGIIFTWLNL